MVEVYKCRGTSIEWKPSAVVALATSPDDSQVAAAREDGTLEVWLVSPGSVGWHCQLTIHGDRNSRVSSIVWCSSGSRGGRLFSSSIDGSVSEWDLFELKQKIVVDSLGVSVWQLAVEPCRTAPDHSASETPEIENGHASEGYSESEDDDDDLVQSKVLSVVSSKRVALACDDGSVRLYNILDSDKLIYDKTFARVSGRTLSVTWSPDGYKIYSGSSDGFIRCWDVKFGHEVYRITVGLGGVGSGPELCVWSLLALRCGTIVSSDSGGNVQFWDSQHGTLLQAHSSHKGDVNALATVPNHNIVFSAGSDGQVVLYKLSNDSLQHSDEKSDSGIIKRWVYVSHVRAHTHDVRALTIAIPISKDDVLLDEKPKRKRTKEKPIDFSYNKWAHLGVPMLISGGDDTKLFAYSAKEFTKFSPHDVCPTPQRLPIQVVLSDTQTKSQTPLLLVQASDMLDIFCVRTKSRNHNGISAVSSGGVATTELLARIKTKASRKIITSCISPSGSFIAYSDNVKPGLFELEKGKFGRSTWNVKKRQLPGLPSAHSMAFSFDSSRLMVAGQDRLIYVVDVVISEVVHVFTPCHGENTVKLPPSEPPITKMFTSADGQWLVAVNCFGDIYIFNLEIERQHWFISRLDGASVTAGGFTPHNNNILIISTSSNQVYAFDLEAKKLGDWSLHNTFTLPRRYQEFPGEVIGLSFPPSSNSSSVVIYSARAMCLIDFGLPIDREDDNYQPTDDHNLPLKKFHINDSSLKKIPINGNLKRKYTTHEILDDTIHSRKNFEFCAFRDPVLFVGHLSKKSLLVIDKPWMNVLKTFDTNPVDRHIYGS